MSRSVIYTLTSDNHIEVTHGNDRQWYRADEIGIMAAATRCALIAEVYGGRSATNSVGKFISEITALVEGGA